MKEKTKKYIAYTLIVFWAALCAVSYFLMLNVRGGDIVLGVAAILFVGVGVVATYQYPCNYTYAQPCDQEQQYIMCNCKRICICLESCHR